MFRIRILFDPFHFGQLDPDPLQWNGSGKQKISQNHGKFPQKSIKITRISYIFFSDINIYPIKNKTDHISEKCIFYRKKSKTKVDIFRNLGQIWSRILIRYFTKRIRGSGSGSVSSWRRSKTLLVSLVLLFCLASLVILVCPVILVYLACLVSFVLLICLESLFLLVCLVSRVLLICLESLAILFCPAILFLLVCLASLVLLVFLVYRCLLFCLVSLSVMQFFPFHPYGRFCSSKDSVLKVFFLYILNFFVFSVYFFFC